MKIDNDEKWIQRQLQYHKRLSEELYDLLESTINFKKWHFKRYYISIVPETPPHVIYDSEWCRIRFNYSGIDQYRGYGIKVYYGRLHASNDKYMMDWNGQQCGCWHYVNTALDFLDGLSPIDASNRLKKNQSPHVIEQFKRSELGQKLERDNEREWILRMHAVIWEEYRERLFYLFDLRQPNLWEQFTDFLRKYYKIVGVSPYPGAPGNEQIC